MSLPHAPESIEHAAARWAAALEKVWDVDGVAEAVASGGTADRPGNHRAHVFDVVRPATVPEPKELLYRVIASIDRSQRMGVTILHVSVSVAAKPPFETLKLSAQAFIERFGPTVRWLVDLLSGGDTVAVPAETIVSPGGVMHLCFAWPLVGRMTPQAAQLAKSMPRFPEPDARAVAGRILQLRRLGFSHGPIVAGQPSSLEQFAAVIASRDQDGGPTRFYLTRHRELLARADEVEAAFGVRPVDFQSEQARQAVEDGRCFLPENFDA